MRIVYIRIALTRLVFELGFRIAVLYFKKNNRLVRACVRIFELRITRSGNKRIALDGYRGGNRRNRMSAASLFIYFEISCGEAFGRAFVYFQNVFPCRRCRNRRIDKLCVVVRVGRVFDIFLCGNFGSFMQVGIRPLHAGNIDRSVADFELLLCLRGRRGIRLTVLVGRQLAYAVDFDNIVGVNRVYFVAFQL